MAASTGLEPEWFPIVPRSKRPPTACRIYSPSRIILPYFIFFVNFGVHRTIVVPETLSAFLSTTDTHLSNIRVSFPLTVKRPKDFSVDSHLLIDVLTTIVGFTALLLFGEGLL